MRDNVKTFTSWHMCTQQRLRSAWTSMQSDQSLLYTWRNIESLGIQNVSCEDSDRTAWVWIFAGLICLKNSWCNYRIRPDYRSYPYKGTWKQFCSLQVTASVLFVYFLIKAYVVGTHLNCILLSMQFKWVPTTYVFIKKIRKKKTKNNTKTLHKHQ